MKNQTQRLPGEFIYIDMLEEVVDETMRISTTSVRSHLLPRIIDEMDIDTMTETTSPWPAPGSDVEAKVIAMAHEEALIMNETFDGLWRLCPICFDPKCIGSWKR